MKLDDIPAEQVRAFIDNPCWEYIKEDLQADKDSHYEIMTTEATKKTVVKSKADKINVIDKVLQFGKDLNNLLHKTGEKK